MRYEIDQINFIIINPLPKDSPEYLYFGQHALQVCETLYALPPGKDEEKKHREALERFQKKNDNFTWFSFTIAAETSQRQERLKYQLLRSLQSKLISAVFEIEHAWTRKGRDALGEIFLFASRFASLNRCQYTPVAEEAEKCLKIADPQNNEVAEKRFERLGMLIKRLGFDVEMDITADLEGDPDKEWF